MSITMFTQAWEAEVSGTRHASKSDVKLTLLALADHCNPQTGQCNPGMKYLVKKIGISSERSVRYALRALEEAGLIRSLGQRKGWELFPESAILQNGESATSPHESATSPSPFLVGTVGTGGTYGTSGNGVDAYASKPKEPDPQRRQSFESAKLALAEVWGVDLKFADSAAHGRLGRAANVLVGLGVPDGAHINGHAADLPTAIRFFGEVWVKLYPDTECPPQTVTREWGRFVNGSMATQALGREEERESKALVRRKLVGK